jgi:dienelactone hydrolase
VALGHSSGGSTALLAAALDPRLDGVVASGCVGYIRDTLMKRADGGGQNVIPGILHWLEMDDVVALCAPRPTLLISGATDHIWPAEGMKAVADSAAAVFAAVGAEDRLACVSTRGGHRFYPDETWRAVAELFGEAET